MSIFQSILLGIVQGVTEFLPISSSGHLVLSQHLLGWQEPNLAFDVFVHFATLLAVAVFFYRDIINLKKTEIIALGLGTIPAVIVGLSFKNQIESLFGSLQLVSLMLIVTGLINLVTDRKLETTVTKEKKSEITPMKGFVVGLFQSVAIVPGISRSGSTVAGGVWQGLDRMSAFRFSFLLSIPAVAGATLLQLLDLSKDGFVGVTPLPFLIGGAAAFVSGFLSLRLFRYIMAKARLEWFGWYCVVLGSGFLIFS